MEFINISNLIQKGWKAILIVSLFILEENKKQLMEEKGPQILHYLNNLPGSNYFSNQEIGTRLIKFYKLNKISNNLLKQLEEEFNYIIDPKEEGLVYSEEITKKNYYFTRNGEKFKIKK